MKKGVNTDQEDQLGHTAAWYAMDSGNSSIKSCLDPAAEPEPSVAKYSVCTTE